MTYSSEVMREMPWPFPDGRFPDELGAVVMTSVLSGTRPALQVLHDPENGWSIADGVDDPNTPGGAVATHIRHIIEMDPTLEVLASIPRAPWQIDTRLAESGISGPSPGNRGSSATLTRNDPRLIQDRESFVTGLFIR